MENEIEEKKELICNQCGYKWETKSKLHKVSCPSCLNKVKNIQEEDDKDL